MKIPVKRYVPNPEVVKTIGEILAGDFPDDHQQRVVDLVWEFLNLQKHHEEETSWLIREVKRLELLAKD